MDDSREADLDDIRKAIDQADRMLIEVLAARWKALGWLKMYKCKHKIAIDDLVREQSLKSKWKQEAKAKKVPEHLALLILDFILAESKNFQDS